MAPGSHSRNAAHDPIYHCPWAGFVWRQLNRDVFEQNPRTLVYNGAKLFSNSQPNSNDKGIPFRIRNFCYKREAERDQYHPEFLSDYQLSATNAEELKVAKAMANDEVLRSVMHESGAFARPSEGSELQRSTEAQQEQEERQTPTAQQTPSDPQRAPSGGADTPVFVNDHLPSQPPQTTTKPPELFVADAAENAKVRLPAQTTTKPVEKPASDLVHPPPQPAQTTTKPPEESTADAALKANAKIPAPTTAKSVEEPASDPTLQAEIEALRPLLMSMSLESLKAINKLRHEIQARDAALEARKFEAAARKEEIA